jgi:hypothetical protein
MSLTLREIIMSEVHDTHVQMALVQALLREGFSLEPPIIEGAPHRLRGTAYVLLESQPGPDGSVGSAEFRADLNVWLDPVIQEGQPWPAGGVGFSTPDEFVRYNVQAEGFTVALNEDERTHLSMRLHEAHG